MFQIPERRAIATDIKGRKARYMYIMNLIYRKARNKKYEKHPDLGLEEQIRIAGAAARTVVLHVWLEF